MVVWPLVSGQPLLPQKDDDTDERHRIVREVMQAHGAELANSLVTDLACLPMDMNEEITVVLYEMFQFSAQVGVSGRVCPSSKGGVAVECSACPRRTPRRG